MLSNRFLTLAALALGAHAHTSSSAASLDEAFRTAVSEKRVPGITAIALNRDGAVIYNSSWGTINIDDPTSAPVTSSTKMAIASMTKSVVSVAALQLVEQDKLSLEDYVEDYIPAWKNITVLDGFNADGAPILRAPKIKPTILHLVTHTAGQPHIILSDAVVKWTEWAGKQTVNPPRPLFADPGTAWFYGYDTDILGNVIEAISGLRLDAYVEYNIFKPLGIKNSGFIQSEIYLHRRYENGSLSASGGAPGPRSPTAVPNGGGYLVSTPDDYTNFLLTLINWGTHPRSGVTLIKSSTIKKFVYRDFIPRAITGDPKDAHVGVWNSVDPATSLSAEFLPGVPKGWSAAFMLNKEDIPGRRRAGSGAWAGAFNTFYWVDPKSGKLGAIFTNLLPFLDPEVLELYDKLEEFVYSL